MHDYRPILLLGEQVITRNADGREVIHVIDDSPTWTEQVMGIAPFAFILLVALAIIYVIVSIYRNRRRSK